MSKRENCEHRHTNGNCLFNGGFCLANDEEHCVRINEIKAYNQALEDCRKLCGTDRPNYTDCSNCMFAHFENDFDTTICKLEQLKK